MKVLLVSHSGEDISRPPYHPNEPYPLGLAYIASFLEAKGHEVALLCLNSFDFSVAHESILAKIIEFKPEVLGIQMFTMNRVSSYRLIEYCSENYPDLRIVVGGMHVSIMAEQIVGKYRNVIAVVGEGEITFSELLAAFANGSNLEGIKGLVYSREGKVVRTAERELILDLDLLPHPKHEALFDAEPKRTTADIITSRGCPFMCSFCCLHNISHRKYRVRSSDDVIKEIADLKTKYPRLRTIQIHDDTFTLDNGRVIELCKKLISLNLDIGFSVSARVKPVSEEMLSYMEKAGVKKIMFGLESGADKIMASNRKGITKKDVVELFNKLKNHNFLVTTFIIVGLPGENQDTVDETIVFVKKLQKIKYSYIPQITILLPFPGTEVYRMMEEANCISDDYWLTDGDVPYFSVEHDLNSLIKFESKMLNHLSIERILTPKGFIHHFISMPLVILKFLYQNKEDKNIIKGIPIASIKTMSPPVYKLLYRIYRSSIVYKRRST